MKKYKNGLMSKSTQTIGTVIVPFVGEKKSKDDQRKSTQATGIIPVNFQSLKPGNLLVPGHIAYIVPNLKVYCVFSAF